MKKRKFKFFKSGTLLLLLSVLLIGARLEAQVIPPTNTGTLGGGNLPLGWSQVAGGTCDVSDVNGWGGYSTAPWINGPVSLPPNGHTSWIDGWYNEPAVTTVTGLTPGLSYSFTFYAAELVSYAGVTGGGPYPNMDGTLELRNNSTNALLGSYTFTGGSSPAWNTWTCTFTATASTLPIKFAYNLSTQISGSGNFWNVSLGAPPCQAGSTAPPLSATSVSNVCPAATANLTTLHTGTVPSGASMVWFTNSAHTGAAYATPSAATAGTYYAFYYDAVNDCYSPASAAVTVSINPCSISLSNVCPSTTVDLTTHVSGTPPAGTSVVWFTNSTHTGAAYATPTAATAGTYYAFYYDAVNNCYSPSSISVVVTTTPCCSAVAPVLGF